MIMADQVFTVPFEYPSQDGKSTINAKMWTNTKFGTSEQEGSEKPKGIIQIVHGMAEYIDRYAAVLSYAAKITSGTANLLQIPASTATCPSRVVRTFCLLTSARCT